MYLREMDRFGFLFMFISEKLIPTVGEYLNATSFDVYSDEFHVLHCSHQSSSQSHCNHSVVV